MSEVAPDGRTEDADVGITAEPRSARPSPANDLAAGLRRMADLLVGRDLPPDQVDAAARQVSELADRLQAVAEPGKASRRFPDREGPPQDYFATSPVIGFANPLAPPAEVWAVETGAAAAAADAADDAGDAAADGAEGADGAARDGAHLEMRGRVVFGYPYEGPPTCVHGGVIACLFDELLGTTNILTGHAAMTGTLTVRYRRPTPLLADLDLEARLVGVDGRKVHLWGAILHEGEITAEADGIFVEAGPRKMLDIALANASAAKGDVIDDQVAAAIQMARSRPSQ